MEIREPLKIASVEAVPLAARLKVPFRFGNVVRTTSANVLVRVTTEDGLVGYGEACPVPQLTAEMDEDKILVVNVSGRGDKDIFTVAEARGVKL